MECHAAEAPESYLISLLENPSGLERVRRWSVIRPNLE
jgi:hypothetical protein